MTEMKLSMVAVATVLFVCLSPGILFKIPIKASPLVIVVLHGVIFGTVLYILVEASLRASTFENFESRPTCENGAVFFGGAGKCVNSTTKKLSAPVCNVGTTFNPATNMCGSRSGMGIPTKGNTTKGVTTRAATTKVATAPASKSKSSFNKRK